MRMNRMLLLAVVLTATVTAGCGATDKRLMARCSGPIGECEKAMNVAAETSYRGEAGEARMKVLSARGRAAGHACSEAAEDGNTGAVDAAVATMTADCEELRRIAESPAGGAL